MAVYLHDECHLLSAWLLEMWFLRFENQTLISAVRSRRLAGPLPNSFLLKHSTLKSIRAAYVAFVGYRANSRVLPPWQSIPCCVCSNDCKGMCWRRCRFPSATWRTLRPWTSQEISSKPSRSVWRNPRYVVKSHFGKWDGSHAISFLTIQSVKTVVISGNPLSKFVAFSDASTITEVWLGVPFSFCHIDNWTLNWISNIIYFIRSFV